jgi:predicted enzyme related to lactoylglutathione lyase
MHVVTVSSMTEDAPVIEVHAYVEVEDTEAGVAFYIAALGLTVRRRLTPRWVELAGASIPIFILGNRSESFDAGGVAIAREFTRHWTPVHLDFVVDELDAWVRRARKAGAVVEREEAYDTFRMANCSDPFGNGFDLIQMAPGALDSIVAMRLP